MTDLRATPDGRVLMVCHRHPGGAIDLCPVERGPTGGDHDAPAGYRVSFPEGWRHARFGDGRRRPIVTMHPESVAELPAYQPPPVLLAPVMDADEARVRAAWERLGDPVAVERELWCEPPRMDRARVRDILRRIGGGHQPSVTTPASG